MKSEQVEHIDTLVPVSALIQELERAERKFPGWPVDPIHGMAIVMEEAGEAQRAVMHYVYEGGSIDELRRELIQTAAMACRFLAFLDKQEPTREPPAGKRWIPVTERLPDERQNVLFVVAPSDKDYAGMVQAGRYSSFAYNDGFVDREFSFPGRTTHATHWMSLPEPPVVEEKAP